MVYDLVLLCFGQMIHIFLAVFSPLCAVKNHLVRDIGTAGCGSGGVNEGQEAVEDDFFVSKGCLCIGFDAALEVHEVKGGSVGWSVPGASGSHAEPVGELFALGDISQAIDLRLDDSEGMNNDDWDACEEVLHDAEWDGAQHAGAEEVSVLVCQGD